MTNVILVGINGKMGHVICRMASESSNVNIVCGVDVTAAPQEEIPVYSSFDDVCENADVIIDFSHPASLSSTLKYAAEKSLPCIIATTGFNEEQKLLMKKASENIPIFFSANMSLGINLLIDLAQKAARLLSDSFDIEITEKHHNQKIDAPSGTALAIADAISSCRDASSEYIFDRHSTRKKRSKNEIGIHSVRGGPIVGEHEVLFAGTDEMIELKHTACSKEIFATGALKAAVFMKDKPSGLYSMNDLINSKEGDF